MCKDGNYQVVRVKIPADLSSTGKEKWKDVSIDYCIADVVDALQKDGIDMRGSCCGHGRMPGYIQLQDGRLLILTDDRYLVNEWEWHLNALRQFFLLKEEQFDSLSKDTVEHIRRLTGKTDNPFPYTGEEIMEIKEDTDERT